MTGIRVLRVIEYEYATPERAEQDMARWTHARFDPTMRMKSATLPFETIEWDSPLPEPDWRQPHNVDVCPFVRAGDCPYHANPDH